MPADGSLLGAVATALPTSFTLWLCVASTCLCIVAGAAWWAHARLARRLLVLENRYNNKKKQAAKDEKKAEK